MPNRIHVLMVAESEGDSLPLLRELERADYDIEHQRVNSRDAMPAGGTIRVATHEAVIAPKTFTDELGPRPGHYVKLQVSDTGTGMDEETQEHIFEPFFSTKSEADGTGLGLSMAFGVVKQMGGAITVASSPGEGTTFEIYLPVACADG